MKVVVLCHKELMPTAKFISSLAMTRQQFQYNRHRLENSSWRTEGYVGTSLRRLGHQVRYVGIDNDFQPLLDVIKCERPDVIFNLVEEFSGEALLEPFVVNFLELSGVPFTGNSSLGLLLAKNKAAAKVLLTSAKVRVPRSTRNFPQIVKYASEESSRGITDQSVVANRKERLRALARP